MYWFPFHVALHRGPLANPLSDPGKGGPFCWAALSSSLHSSSGKVKEEGNTAERQVSLNN